MQCVYVCVGVCLCVCVCACVCVCVCVCRGGQDEMLVLYDTLLKNNADRVQSVPLAWSTSFLLIPD